ncbi:unnamed protein product [Rotaria socialis]|uniref:Hcy-binding domain-containing protein n=1 Tax=Rotaria socialis TaxID=392032 RepID=A0A818MX96_9BILA|nr:unnamed protein product [Rotaria socialis]CAF4490960.1 unnamed protein product [Rotaria socialis]
MAKYRSALPQLSNKFFITSGGMGTTLIFHEGMDLPFFASFIILKNEVRCEWLKNFYRKFVDIARKYDVGCILKTPTWRASPDWILKLGFAEQDVVDMNRKAIELLCDIRDEYETEKCQIVINGCIGPRGDAYNLTTTMTVEEAQAYHAIQIGVLSQTKADMITAFTLNDPEEAAGMVKAANAVGMPIAISFTVETDGRLAGGKTLKEAIEFVDKVTQNSPIYYMINCAHPTSFEHVLMPDEPWTTRIHGVKGNASKKSHAELDGCKELDSGNPIEFGENNRALLGKLKNLNVFGGCCGTDYRHVEEICKACLDTFNQKKASSAR